MSSVEARRTTRSAGFSEETLIERARSKAEPAWLREMRLEAWREFERAPMPSRKEEEWRRTDLSLLELEAVAPSWGAVGPAPELAELPAELRAALGGSQDRAGLLVHQDGCGSYRWLSPELAARGVIFTDLDAAVRDHPELVQRYLGTRVAPGEGKFTALHYAFWSGGSFVYVPRDVQVELPLQTMTWSSGEGLAVSPHTLIVLEEGASLLLVDECASPEGAGPSLANGAVEITLGANSRLQYVALQRWGSSVYNISSQRAAVRRDAVLNSLSVVLGSHLTKSWVDARLVEPGATAAMTGIMFAGGHQRFHHHTLQDHQAPRTSSDLLYKVALADHARSEYSGLIRVQPDAQKTDAYQANRNLSLSEHARADSMPKLEISANDVRCTHGATVGPIDAEQLFYLMARGLSRPTAERMIVQGFFEPLLEKIPLESVKDRIREAVDRKLGN